MSEQTTTPEVDQTLELNNEMLERRSKLAALRAQGNPSQTISVVTASPAICTPNSATRAMTSWSPWVNR